MDALDQPDEYRTVVAQLLLETCRAENLLRMQTFYQTDNPDEPNEHIVLMDEIYQQTDEFEYTTMAVRFDQLSFINDFVLLPRTEEGRRTIEQSQHLMLKGRLNMLSRPPCYVNFQFKAQYLKDSPDLCQFVMASLDAPRSSRTDETLGNAHLYPVTVIREINGPLSIINSLGPRNATTSSPSSAIDSLSYEYAYAIGAAVMHIIDPHLRRFMEESYIVGVNNAVQNSARLKFMGAPNEILHMLEGMATDEDLSPGKIADIMFTELGVDTGVGSSSRGGGRR